MGILRSGIFGGFRKKAGPLVGRRGRGKNIITGLHHLSDKVPTKLQQDAKDRFSLLTSFLSTISELVNIGFKHYAKNRRPVNVAHSYNYSNAFVMVDDHYLLNYPKIVYSRGHIETPDSAQVFLGNSSLVSEAGSVKFSWLPQGQSVYCQYTDLASFLVYNPEKSKAIIELNVIDRYSLEYSVMLPADFEGDVLHCYMNFASANGKVVGDSVYVGAVYIGVVEVG
nr:DUF6266 family protein [Pedobacter panaciterrae]